MFWFLWEQRFFINTNLHVSTHIYTLLLALVSWLKWSQLCFWCLHFAQGHLVVTHLLHICSDLSMANLAPMSLTGCKLSASETQLEQVDQQSVSVSVVWLLSVQFSSVGSSFIRLVGFTPTRPTDCSLRFLAFSRCCTTVGLCDRIEYNCGGSYWSSRYPQKKSSVAPGYA